MTKQTLYPNHAFRMKLGMKTILNKVLKKYMITFQIMDFYSRGFKGYLLAMLVMSVLLGLMETVQILLIYPILNASFSVTDGGISFFEPIYNFVRNTLNLPEVVSFCLLFILVVFLSFSLSLIYRYISLQFAKNVVLERKGSVFDKLINNDYRYFVDTRRGDVLNSAIYAPSVIISFLNVSAILCSDIVIVLSIIFILSFISPPGVAFLLTVGFLFILIIRLIGKRISYSLGKLQLQSSELENEVISNYVQGVRQIRSVNGDPYWKKKYNDALYHYWEKYVKYDFFVYLPGVTLQFFFFLATASTVILLYYLYQDGFLSIIPLIGVFAFATLKILPKLSNIGSNNMAIMNSWPSLEKVYHFLNDYQYNTIKNGEKRFETLTSDIIFDNVGFSYYKNQDLIKGMHLTIKKDKVTALVGHSGSGKSTVVSLLLRYYDVSKGRILINGINLREYDVKTLLMKVGYVTQDTFLYNATIRENIAFGGDYSEDQIIEAAKKANIHTFISSLSDGYESIVGDQGLKLSGGEKQRVAIARALVRVPEILVLDEATSNLDNESEAIVQDAINQVSKNNTTFIIAHRLSTIIKADMIFVMSSGMIVESGSHDELMEKRGRYFDLYEFKK